MNLLHCVVHHVRPDYHYFLVKVPLLQHKVLFRSFLRIEELVLAYPLVLQRCEMSNPDNDRHDDYVTLDDVMSSVDFKDLHMETEHLVERHLQRKRVAPRTSGLLVNPSGTLKMILTHSCMEIL